MKAKPAPFFRRSVAVCIDALAALAVMLVGLALGPIATNVAIGLVLAAYQLNNWRPLAFGKRLMGLEVIEMNGGRPCRARTSILRRAVTTLPSLVFGALSFAAAKNDFLEAATTISNLGGALGIGLFLADGVIWFFDRHDRRLGDLIAGTMVIRAERAQVTTPTQFATE